ncbi:hypothetical protein ACFFRR_007043 [Megaselia abdita]
MLRGVKSILVVIFVTTVLVLTVCNSEVVKKKQWVEPDAFSRRKPPSLKSTITSSTEISDNGECDCPACEVNAEVQDCLKPEDDIASVLYKRLVSSLIVKDNVPGKRVFSLSVTEKHLKMLESSNDIRDWDGVMSDIIASLERIDLKKGFIYKDCGSNEGFSVFSWFTLFNLSSVGTFLSTSEVQFTLIVILFISLGIFLHKKFKWGMIVMFLVIMFSCGYFYTYYECNRQLEVDELVNIMHNEHNPCEEPKETSYFKSFFRMFSNQKEECRLYLRKKHQIKLTFCRPDDVLIKYLNKIMFDQFQAWMKGGIGSFRSFASEIPFPYNIVAMVTVPFFFFAILKLIFQYIISPSNWFSYYQHHTQPQQPQPVTSRVEMIGGGISQEDFRAVLNTIQAVSSSTSIRTSEPQNLMIEGSTALNEGTTTLNEGRPIPSIQAGESPRRSPPIPRKRKIHKQMSGVEMFDDPDDSGSVSNESGISNESCDKVGR